MKGSMKMAVLSALVAAVALLQPAAADNSQQTRMTTCNADAKAKGLSGDDRKAFMKTCLSGDSAAAAKPLNSQQEKMKSCNADASAKGLKGDARKSFMSTCLSG